MALDDDVRDHSSFSKNNDRLIGSDVADVFLSRIVAQAKRKHLLSKEPFTAPPRHPEGSRGAGTI